MPRFITLIIAVFFTCLLYGQNFPDAQKQPRLKESRTRQKHYAKQAHRRHIRRGTALILEDLKLLQARPVIILASNRRIIRLTQG